MNRPKNSIAARLGTAAIGATAAILFSMAGAAHAGLKDAIAAVERGEYKSARVELEQLARAGNADAMFHLAYMTNAGQGGMKDEISAWTMFNSAAKAGSAQAMTKVAETWISGDALLGVAPDYNTSKQWALKAANAGYIPAMKMLYETPQLDLTDLERLSWMRTADDMGSDAARIAQIDALLLAKRYIDYFMLATATAKAPVNWRSSKPDTPYPSSLMASMYLSSSFKWGSEGIPADKVAAYKWLLVTAAHPAAQSSTLGVTDAVKERLKQKGVKGSPTMAQMYELVAEDLAKGMTAAERAKAKILAEDILSEIRSIAPAIAEKSLRQ